MCACGIMSGYKCPSKGMAAPIPCPSGEYQASEGDTSCVKCPAGSECSDPTRAAVCSAGHFSPDSAINCTACNTGTLKRKLPVFLSL